MYYKGLGGNKETHRRKDSFTMEQSCFEPSYILFMSSCNLVYLIFHCCVILLVYVGIRFDESFVFVFFYIAIY